LFQREVIDLDVRIVAVLEVEVDGRLPPTPLAPNAVPPAVLADIVHRDVGDMRVGQSLDVNALLIEVGERGAV